MRGHSWEFRRSRAPDPLNGPLHAPLGKTTGKDARSNKRTYATELGVDATRRLAREVTEQALAALDVLGDRAEKLKNLALLLCQRKR